MSRRRRTTAILFLLILLVSIWTVPGIAREVDSGEDDWQISTYTEENYGLGDDYDDDPFYIHGDAVTGMLRWILLMLFCMP